MAKISSLMYREWVLTKKTLLLGMAAALGILILGVIIGNGYQHGAFHDKESINTLLSKAGSYMITYLFAFCLTTVAAKCSAVYDSDIKSNWTRYTMSLPADTNVRACAHALFLCIRVAAAYLISLCAGVLISAFFGKAFSADMAADIGLYCCLSLAGICISEFFWSKATDMITYKKQSNRLSATFAGAGVVAGLLIVRTARGGENADIVTSFEPLIEQYTAFRNVVFPFIIPVFIILIALIYVIVKRNFDSLKRA